MKQWISILGRLLALLPLSCVEQTAMSCAPDERLYDGVTRTSCRGIGPGHITLIKIDKFRANSELWVLEELDGRHTAIPTTPTGVGFDGRFLNDADIHRRSQALIQMNGYTFSCDPADPSSRDNTCYRQGLSYPTTTVYESTKRLSNFELTPNPDLGISGQYMFTFKPRNQGPLLEVSPEGVVPLNETDRAYYNAFGNSWPHLLDLNRNGVVDEGECIDGPGQENDWTLLGVSDTHVIMLYMPQVLLNIQTCTFLISQRVGAHTVFQMDGSGSAGMYLKDTTSIGHTGSDWLDLKKRHISYRIGLVTLEEENQVTNGGFEDLPLGETSSGTPPGFHSLSGEQMNAVQWDGAKFLYNTNIYNEWVHTGRQSHKQLLPSLDAQIAAIRTRGDGTNYISQNLTDIPDDRYCMLRFYHGYHQPNGCNEPLSKLTVTAGRCDGSPPDTTAEYYSEPTHGGDPQRLLRNEVWLRLLTPSEGRCMKLTFTASRWNPGVTTGNCEVLLDNVSVHCAQ
jgi:hypothetical protein